MINSIKLELNETIKNTLEKSKELSPYNELIFVQNINKDLKKFFTLYNIEVFDIDFNDNHLRFLIDNHSNVDTIFCHDISNAIELIVEDNFYHIVN